jgi:hypothetical protein
MGQVRVGANVRRYFFLMCAWMFALSVAHAAVCDPRAFHGAYGMSLTGATTIGGPARPVAVVGRLVAEDGGNLSGVSSTSFTGLILGNPTTGRYEAHTDCSVTWSVQDSSGNFQHFAGTMNADGGRVTFRQTDRGGAAIGILLRAVNWCSTSSLAGTFKFKASGRTVDVPSGADSGLVSLQGVLISDGAGTLSLNAGPDQPVVAAGSYEIQSDCFVTLVLEMPAGEKETAPMHFRAILSDDGHEVLGIQTDPGTVVAVRLVSK